MNSTLIDAHRRLRDQLHHLQNLVDRFAETCVNQLCDNLESLEGHLTEHFRLEEEDGYGQDVLDQAPQLERTVRKLQREHAELAQSLSTLTRHSRVADTLDDDLCDRLQQWIAKYHEHESRENQLVENAFLVECGVDG